jgi:hypothetical protein
MRTKHPQSRKPAQQLPKVESVKNSFAPGFFLFLAPLSCPFSSKELILRFGQSIFHGF